MGTLITSRTAISVLDSRFALADSRQQGASRRTVFGGNNARKRGALMTNWPFLHDIKNDMPSFSIKIG